MSLYARLRAYRHVLISDIDGTLLGGESLAGESSGGAPGGPAANGSTSTAVGKALGARLLEKRAALVLASGRNLELSLAAAKELSAAGLPTPTALITGVGSEIYLCDGDLADSQQLDHDWTAHLEDGWESERVTTTLLSVAGLQAQEAQGQSPLKASYYLEPSAREPAAVVAAARGALEEAGLAARLIHSAGNLLDVLPARASKGAAVAWLLGRAAIAPQAAITAGDSGNDREMLLAEIDGVPLKAVVVANHEPELAALTGLRNVYFAERSYAAGVLEGLLAHGW